MARLACLLILCLSPLPLLAQSWSGSVRTRVEAWNWFEGDADPTYAFSGSTIRLALGRQTEPLDWQIEFELPVLLGLPDASIASGAQGQLGLGATYFAANDRSRNAALPFLKQAFMRIKNLGGQAKQSLRVGRFEFVDGTETVPKNSTLAAVKRDRVAHRLLGHFGFTHVGRSFDGLHYVYNGAKDNFTFVGVAPTRGVFQVDGWGPLSIGVLYGAYTRPVSGKKMAGEFRLFGMYYHDWRTVLKTDNRPLALRRADSGTVRIATAGGHYIHAWDTNAGTVDFLFWGAVQAGRWGILDHRAGSASIEAGYQPRVWPRIKPWIRGGVHHGSGDADPADQEHGTFFQVLPTPRWLARFPFYNLMNNQDAFGQLLLKPHARLNIRAEAHWLRLANANDLWYLGGGAFQPWTFGYIGRPSGGSRGLASVFDVSTDCRLSGHSSIGLYFAHAQGRGVMRNIYPKGKNANYGYIELTYRF